MKQFLTNMRPENFEDVIAAISLYRPGADGVPSPATYRASTTPPAWRYETPLLKPILDVTYGCMVYQEQVMQIVRDLAGYSYGRSDLVRRAMAKKKHDVMAKEKEIFIHGQVEGGKVVVPGAVRNGVPEDVAEHIFDEMTAFASYAFNKSHAAAYALVAVQTAWLKLHWPVQFMAALMNSLSGNSDKVGYYIQTCRKRGIRVLPPDVQQFAGEVLRGRNGAIRFGFAGVKNLGHGAIAAIVSEREAGGPYRDIFDLCERVACAGGEQKVRGKPDPRRGPWTHCPAARSQKLCVFERAMDAAGRRQKTAVQGQPLAVRRRGGCGDRPAAAAGRAGLFPAGSVAHGARGHRRVHHRPPAGRIRKRAFPAGGQFAGCSQEPCRGSGRRHGLGSENGRHGRHRRRAQIEGHQVRHDDGLFVQLEDMYGATEGAGLSQGVRPRGGIFSRRMRRCF